MGFALKVTADQYAKAESGEGGFYNLPAGRYLVEIADGVEGVSAAAGNPMATVTFKVMEHEVNPESEWGQSVKDYLVATDNMLWKWGQLAKATGIELDGQEADDGVDVELEISNYVGAQLVIDVENEPFQSKNKDTGELQYNDDGTPKMLDSAKVKKYWPISALLGEEAASGAPAPPAPPKAAPARAAAPAKAAPARAAAPAKAAAKPGAAANARPAAGKTLPTQAARRM